MSKQPIKIGTRDSKLAVWQAVQVQHKLQALGFEAILVPVKSPADIDLNTPLHQFSGTGIFTKMLDEALYRKQVDLAVHSLKDYPTTLPPNISLAAVLERASAEDILVYKGELPKLEEGVHLLASGSIRRQAQWKHRFPGHKLTGLRGNVQTRLKKLEESNWTGAIFAKAGLERIGLLDEKHIVLDWMIPAPAQGIIGITCLEENETLLQILKALNHASSFLEASVERAFLNRAEGGCSAPIGARAYADPTHIRLEAAIFEPDGSNKAAVEQTVPLEQAADLGRQLAEKALAKGGAAIMKKIKNAGEK